MSTEEVSNFKQLGVCDELCEAIQSIGWVKPTNIQIQAIPAALKGQDIIGLAETGSGKTGAFCIPILQALLENPAKIFALVLTPTRELAVQISEQLEALGASIGLKTAIVVGGLDMMQQAIKLIQKPHVIIGTPGRVVDHLTNTKGFSISTIKFLVMDEADRLLASEFEKEINKIVEVAPKDRRTYLFSATMTDKVQKLQRACLVNPLKVQVNEKYQTVEGLVQNYMFIPAVHKDIYMVHLCVKYSGKAIIIFTDTCLSTLRVALMLKHIGLKAVCIHGQMVQQKRLKGLRKFKSHNKSILVATDVASRGLDIPSVDLVINYDVPGRSKDYFHRVGRTARAGRTGRSITLVTQYDVHLFQKVEFLLGKQLEEFQVDKNEVMQLQEKAIEAFRVANNKIKELQKNEQMEDEEEGEGKNNKKRKRNKDKKYFLKKFKKLQ